MVRRTKIEQTALQGRYADKHRRRCWTSSHTGETQPKPQRHHVACTMSQMHRDRHPRGRGASPTAGGSGVWRTLDLSALASRNVKQRSLGTLRAHARCHPQAYA